MFIIMIWFCSNGFKSIQNTKSPKSPNTLKLKFSASVSTLNRIQNALFLNHKHNILTPRVLKGWILATNSSEIERQKVHERVGFKAECPLVQHPVKENTPADAKKN